MLRWIGTALLVGIVGVVGLLVKRLHDLGQFREVESRFDGTCRHVRGMIGPEDLTLDLERGRAYISGYDRRGALRGEPSPGAIHAYALDAEGEEPRLVNLTPDADLGFQPHGISLFRGPQGDTRLFVVNHPAPQSGRPAHTIEIFAFDDEGGLVHLRSIEDAEHLITPNDLVAVGPDQFYVTNTHRATGGISQFLENALGLSRAFVAYYDGSSFRVGLDPLSFPNGINVSPDGRTLYVATTTPRTLLVYDRDPETESLERRTEVFVGSGLDNIEVDEAGDLWIGAHPKMTAVAAYVAGQDARSPSLVVQIPSDTLVPREVYVDDGSEFSGSSTAAYHRNRLLIGQIAGDGILDCTLAAAP